MNLPTATGLNFWAPSPDSPERFAVWLMQDRSGDPPEKWVPCVPGPDPDSRERPLTLRYICWGKNVARTARTVANMGGVWLGPCVLPKEAVK